MKCVICGDKTSYENNYYFCDNCDYIFKNQDSILSLEEEKQRYTAHNNTIENLKYVEYFKDFVEQIIPYINGKVGLDYGSGHGNVLEYVMENFFDYDIDSYDKYFNYDITLKNKYDFVICTEVIEHIQNPIEFIKIIDSYLSSENEIVFKTQFRNMSEEEFYKWWYIRDDTHIGFYNMKTFEYIAKIFDYNIIFSDNNSIVVLRKN